MTGHKCHESSQSLIPEVRLTHIEAGTTSRVILTIDGVEHLSFSQDAPMRPFHASVETYLRTYFEINGLTFPEEEPWWLSLLGSVGFDDNLQQ